MKKILLLAALTITSFTFAQEKEEEETTGDWSLGLHTSFGDHNSIGFIYESDGLVIKEKVYTVLMRGSYSSYEYDGSLEAGSGEVYELGARTYYSKKKNMRGFYTSNYLSYGSYKFDEQITSPIVSYKFEGKYSFISFLSPEVGYKIGIGKSFSIDPFVGITWKIEIKGKGDVDNKNTNEWSPKAGINLAWEF